MSKHIVLIDKRLDKYNFVNILEKKFHIVHQPLDEEQQEDDNTPLLVVVNVHLENMSNVAKLKPLLKAYPNSPKLFLVNDLYNEGAETAKALGAQKILVRPAGTVDTLHDSKELQALDRFIKVLVKKSMQNLWAGIPEQDKKALESVDKVNHKITESIIAGDQLPKEEISATCNEFIESMHTDTIGPWLKAVKTHHSYTHRHCITVTGLAIALGMHFNMGSAEIKRLATGALMHDIGKVKIPLSVLDKPAKLAFDEIELIRNHPIYSAEILREDGQFGEDIVDLALSHHELLDGSGYPNKLSGSQISDSVRMLTIIDIFSALVDQRSYKRPMSGEDAINMMEKMEGMLDLDLLRAFRPVALNIQSDAA